MKKHEQIPPWAGTGARKSPATCATEGGRRGVGNPSCQLCDVSSVYMVAWLVGPADFPQSGG